MKKLVEHHNRVAVCVHPKQVMIHQQQDSKRIEKPIPWRTMIQLYRLWYTLHITTSIPLRQKEAKLRYMSLQEVCNYDRHYQQIMLLK